MDEAQGTWMSASWECGRCGTRSSGRISRRCFLHRLLFLDFVRADVAGFEPVPYKLPNYVITYSLSRTMAAAHECRDRLVPPPVRRNLPAVLAATYIVLMLAVAGAGRLRLAGSVTR